MDNILPKVFKFVDPSSVYNPSIICRKKTLSLGEYNEFVKFVKNPNEAYKSHITSKIFKLIDTSLTVEEYMILGVLLNKPLYYKCIEKHIDTIDIKKITKMYTSKLEYAFSNHLLGKQNPIKNLDPIFTYLEYLDCSYNQEIRELPETYVNLEELIFNENHNVCGLPETYVNLKKIKLDDCHFECIIPETYTKLEEIYCINSRLKEIPDIPTLKKLTFSCYTIKPVTIPDTLVNLIELDVSYTLIKEIPDTLINLEELYVCESRINKIPGTLVNLQYLDVSETEIKEIPDTLINLTELDVSKTEIEKIPDTLINLKYLNIASTKIKNIPDTLVNVDIDTE